MLGSFRANEAAVWSWLRDLGFRSGIGGNGVIPFSLSFYLSFSYLSFLSGDEG
jgi:hypothetical protein